MKKAVIKQIAAYMTPEELRQFELVKAFHNRSNNSDMIRVLIKNEAEKILPKNSTVGMIQEAAR